MDVYHAGILLAVNIYCAVAYQQTVDVGGEFRRDVFMAPLRMCFNRLYSFVLLEVVCLQKPEYFRVVPPKYN